ncbi:MAG: ltaS [Firmicutes bacterium]|nr:ltaS [Bacillota bacterium]
MSSRTKKYKQLNNKIPAIMFKLKEMMFGCLDVIIITGLIIAKNLHYGKQIAEYYNPYTLIIPIVCSILPLVGIFFLLKEEKRVRALFIFDLAVSLILFADTAYFRYFKDITSIGAVRNGALLGGVMSCLPSLIKFNDIAYFIDLIVLLPLIKMFAAYKKRKKYKLGGAVRVMLFLLVFGTGVMANGKCIYNFNIEQPLLLTTMSNKLFLTKVLGNFNYHTIDIYNYARNTIEASKPVSAETKQDIRTYLQGNQPSDSGSVLAGAGEGKNLIMIQVEALQQFAINKSVNGQEITPNLNRWINKSLYFDNYYYQVSAGNTSDAEFMSNNSLYPAASGSAYYRYSGNTLDSLPNKLRNEGYSTAAFHGYVESFWNRNIMYQTEGFDNFYGETSFNVDDTVGLGLSDKSFFEQSKVTIQGMEEPYFSFLVTLSSHYPFDGGAGYGDFNAGEYEGSLMGDYLKGIHYADQQLGLFLDELEEDGTLEDTIVVVYGDHSAIPKEYADQLYSFAGVENPTELDWQMLQEVPMFIHFPGNANSGVNHTYSGQMDLYPTLANIFNLECKYTFGKDILNSGSQKVIFRNGSFTDGNTFYMSGSNTYYDIATEQIVAETDQLKAAKEQAMNELNLSDNLLNHDLIGEGLEQTIPEE